MTDLCRYAGNDNPRVLIGRHVDVELVDEEGVQIHSGDDCTGCQPCTSGHCVVCRAEHVDQEQTCPTCIANAKERLKSVYGLNKHLAEEALNGGQHGRLAAARPIPGGDATVLRGPGSDSSSVTFMEDMNEFAEHVGWPKVDVSHKHDERHNEALPTRQLLEQWEDVWRKELGNRVRHRTLLTTTKFLSEHVSWAAQRTDSFAEFVRDISRHAAVLEALLHDGTFYEHGGAPCFRCAGVLERKAADPRPCKHARLAQKAAKHWNEPNFSTVHLLVYLERWMPKAYDEHAKCDQGGGIDVYECGRCHWRYDNKSYWLAVREEIEKVEATKAAEPKPDDVAAFTKKHLDVGMTPWQEDFLRQHFKHLAPKKETA